MFAAPGHISYVYIYYGIFEGIGEQRRQTPQKKNSEALDAIVYNMHNYIKLKTAVNFVDKNEGGNVFPHTPIGHSKRKVNVSTLRVMESFHSKE